MATQTSFCNISLNSTIMATLEPEYAGLTEAEVILRFIDMSTDGAKFSFSWKESKSAYCVAVTLPDFRTTNENVCATFWHENLFDALLEALLVVEFFSAITDGFYAAKGRISAYEKDLAARLKRFSEEGNTPVRTRSVE